VTEVLSTTVFS